MKQIRVELQETMGGDESIANAAWTSSLDYQKKKTRTSEDVKRVVKMLAENKHSTPFESVIFRFWIKLPIAVDRHILTHRIATHNGMSGRYRTMPNEYLDIPDDIESIMNKFESKAGNKENPVEINLFQEYYNLCELANNTYQIALNNAKTAEKENKLTNSEYKRFREFFRGVLPQHNMTERVTIMNLRSFTNFQKLRNSPHAQPEIQEVARLMLEAVKKANVCPIALEELEKNGWVI